MINARPHINGNTSEHFEEAYNALVEAMRKVQNARDVLSNNVLNGRNYQHIAVLESGEKLNADRRRAFADVAMVVDLLESLAADVANAVNP